MARLKLHTSRTFYDISKSDAEKVKTIWLNKKLSNDTKINIDSLVFRKGDVQFIDLDDPLKDTKRNMDLPNSFDREKVRKFEEELRAFFRVQPEHKRTFEHYLQHCKIVSFSRSHIAESGKERFDLGTMVIHNHKKYTEMFSLYNALGDLCSKREYAQKKQFEYYEKIIK